jgi:manganese transport protein
MNSVVIGGRLSPVRPSRWSSWSFRLKKLLAFAGPGYLVAVGYMDPGNWATSLAGGSSFGYSLLSVILLSNVMAMLLQAAAVRLGIATGMDLAQSCRHFFGSRMSILLWLGCEVAIIACNLAEVLGMACGLQLLFHTPLTLGVCLTVLDVFLVLLLQRRGARYLETFIISLIALIGACFAAQLWWLHPHWGAVAEGFVPTTDVLTRPDMLYLAVGIIGATVMPHNLYLHSSLVQTRRQDISGRGLTRAIQYATWDSNVALGLALLVKVGILILAAGAFHRPGLAPVVELQDAYQLLSPLLGVGVAGAVFGVGLIASGLSSSITGTLAGQVVMEGFLSLRVSPAKRAFITRCLAILPAVGVSIAFGAAGVTKLLVLSQVILGIQLPFAVIPLLWFTTRSRYLGTFAFRKKTALALWSTAVVVTVVNVWVIAKLV